MFISPGIYFATIITCLYPFCFNKSAVVRPVTPAPITTIFVLSIKKKKESSDPSNEIKQVMNLFWCEKKSDVDTHGQFFRRVPPNLMLNLK